MIDLDEESSKDALKFLDYDGTDKHGSKSQRICGQNEELNPYGECVEIGTFHPINDLLALFEI